MVDGRPWGSRVGGIVTKATQRFAHIDAMRAFAVLIVVVAHAGVAVAPGGAGVTVFFAISGFIITHLVLRERDRTGTFDIRGFYVRRALKIMPPLIVAIMLPTVVYAAFGGPIDWLQVGSQLFFVANWLYAFEVPSFILPGSRVVWSLAIEEQFYILFAIIWLWLLTRRWWHAGLVWLSSVAIVVPVLLRTYFYLSAGTAAEDRVYAGTDTRVDAIAIGMLAALVYRGVKTGAISGAVVRVLAWPGLPLIAGLLFVGTLAYRDPAFRMVPMYALQSLATALVLLNGLLLSEGRYRQAYERVVSFRPLQVVGLASYSIYLTHAPLIYLMEPITSRLNPGVAVLVNVSVGVLSGVALWFVVERPVERFKKTLYPSTAQPIRSTVP